MGIQTGWYINDQVIYVNFYNRVTVEEFHEMNRVLVQMIASSSADILHIIQDESNIKSAPPQFGQLLRDSVISRGMISGCVLCVGKYSEHKVMKFISTAMAKLGNARYQRFHFLEEAEAYLEAVDPSIDLYAAKRHHMERTLIPEVDAFSTV